MGDFGFGIVYGILVTSALFIVNLPDTTGKINKTCQGTAWVIEEPLIKKTLTCVVEIKENK